MASWTTGEIRRLKEAHIGARPTFDELAAMFPRHTPIAVYARAADEGLRKRPHRLSKFRGENSHAKWLRIAHMYFSRRELGL